ncbi:hypothetical protein HK097_009707 [Rhizophlyctis rosea]|uniref:Uncharacterized protein n=1 Tax=Rhizophlyctis rosea TaxID=64517 RepID=A0AAD5SA65_9FUNG|nr:hypothetical protein HK097_009707 [Rhizophlyctis rosea]
MEQGPQPRVVAASKILDEYHPRRSVGIPQPERPPRFDGPDGSGYGFFVFKNIIIICSLIITIVLTYENIVAIRRDDINTLELAWTTSWHNTVLDKLLTRSLQVQNRTQKPWIQTCDALEYQIWYNKATFNLALLPETEEYITTTNELRTAMLARLDYDRSLQTTPFDQAVTAIDINGDQWTLSHAVDRRAVAFKNDAKAKLSSGITTLNRTTTMTARLSIGTVCAVIFLEICRFIYAVYFKKNIPEETGSFIATTKVLVKQSATRAKNRVTLSNGILLLVSLGAMIDEAATKYVLTEKMKREIVNLENALQFYTSSWEASLFNEELISTAAKFVATGNVDWANQYKKLNESLLGIPTGSSDPFIANQFKIIFAINDGLVKYEAEALTIPRDIEKAYSALYTPDYYIPSRVFSDAGAEITKSARMTMNDAYLTLSVTNQLLATLSASLHILALATSASLFMLRREKKEKEKVKKLYRANQSSMRSSDEDRDVHGQA